MLKDMNAMVKHCKAMDIPTIFFDWYNNIKQIHICCNSWMKRTIIKRRKNMQQWQNCKIIFYNKLHQVFLNIYTHQFKNAEHIKKCLSIYTSVLSIRNYFSLNWPLYKIDQKTCIIIADFQLGLFHYYILKM